MRVARATLVLVAGAALALAAQVAAPIGVPLYDGVVVQEPYRYLQPPSGQEAAPTSASVQPEVTGQDGLSKPFNAATQEYPPQAQLIAAAGSFVTAAGAQLLVRIEPVAPTSQPAGSRIAGNVYRIAVTDATGAPVAIDSRHPPTVSLRAPADVVGAKLARSTADGWQALPTEHGGLFGLYASQVTELGDFALITPDTGLGLLPAAIGLGAGLTLAGVVAFLLFRRRRAIARPPEPARRPAAPVRRAQRQRRPPGRRR